MWIFIITDMGGLQHFQMQGIFSGAIPFNDFMPDSIDKGVEVLNLHGGNPVHINLNVRKKLDKVLMGGKFAKQTVVNLTAFQKCHHFMTIDTPLPPCMPFPRALEGFLVSSSAKVMYCRMLDATLSKGQADENGILFVCFPVTAIAAVLSCSTMTVKRSLNELENAGLIMLIFLSPLFWKSKKDRVSIKENLSNR